jgi:hypothetical protein
LLLLVVRSANLAVHNLRRSRPTLLDIGGQRFLRTLSMGRPKDAG